MEEPSFLSQDIICFSRTVFRFVLSKNSSQRSLKVLEIAKIWKYYPLLTRYQGPSWRPKFKRVKSKSGFFCSSRYWYFLVRIKGQRVTRIDRIIVTCRCRSYNNLYPAIWIQASCKPFQWQLKCDVYVITYAGICRFLHSALGPYFMFTLLKTH